MDTTSRKAWITPQVFVLGAEGTQAYSKGGTSEIKQHLAAQVIHVGSPIFSDFAIAGSDNIAVGYQS